MRKSFLAVGFLLIVTIVSAQRGAPSPEAVKLIKDNYTKIERLIPMRDGVKLFTAIYIPKDSTQSYPFMLNRTPYSVRPYGEENYPARLGPSSFFATEKFIFVSQDARGRYMSEGEFREMSPAMAVKKTNKDVDESSDTYDTIEWLLKNIAHNNGKAGIYGISYPGFYTSAALPNAHPALVAASPQAPMSDEFEGDDANHRGAFFLMDNFGFMNGFDHARPGPWQQYPRINNNIKIDDAYDFYLKIGPIKNLNTLYFHDSSKIWNQYLQHTSKDTFWQARNLRPHLKNIKPAVLVVGGWYDAEDMFGALETYKAIETQSPGNNNRLVMGPWTHGAWSRGDWTKFAGIEFGSNTSAAFQQLELNFFNYYLKGKGKFDVAEATIFVTGSNQWKSFAQWPPKESVPTKLFLNEAHKLSLTGATKGFDEYISDPANPVPYINKKSAGRVGEYMAADQTFASLRNDVLYYTSGVLDADITVYGEIVARLSASISNTDADFVIKVIDVLPDSANTQQLVRAEILRGKFRNSFSKPEAFVPDKITPVTLQLNDVAHTFLKGHKIMVQVQSSWFPLVDRNPQKFMNIPDANEEDFHKAAIRIYHDVKNPSFLEMRIVK